MRRFALSMGLFFLCFLGFMAAPGGPARAALETVFTGDDHKTTLCHATGNSDTFPAGKYVLIPPSEAGAVFGHLGTGHQNGNDIIPPFQYDADGDGVEEAYSQHWDAVGQAIFAAGCGEPDDTTTTTTTTTDTTTTTVIEPPKPPCPITPSNPTGALPNPAGGKDGKPGNDECKPDEPPVTTTSTTPTTPAPTIPAPTTPAPTTPAPTTPTPTTPEPTTTEETTPYEPAGQPGKPDKPSKPDKPRSTPDTTPTSEEKLPLTGFPLLVIALLGGALLAGGLYLRKL